MAERLIVRSYRRVFRIDRRIYRVDRWALPVPGGVPLRGLAYFFTALAVLIAASALPLIGSLVDELSPPLRYVVVPLGAAVLGTQAAPDGRAAHRFAWSWLTRRLRSRRRSAGRAVPLEREPVPWDGTVATVWDEHAPSLHRGRVHGPARVTFSVPVMVAQRRRGVIATGRPRGRPGSVVVGARQVVEVRR
jgi:TcpE family